MRSECWEYEPCAAKLSIARVLVDDQQGPDAIGATTRAESVDWSQQFGDNSNCCAPPRAKMQQRPRK